MKRIFAIIAVMALVLFGGTAIANSAVSTAQPVAVSATCVPKAAWTETIEHPAVTHVVHHDAVPSQWWNWSPNDTKGPQDYEPAFPTDERGTWQGPHTNGGPDGTGTFNVSNENSGNSSWFHREPGTAAFDEVVVDHEAYTETVEHPAVTCTGPTPPEVTDCVSNDSCLPHPHIRKHHHKDKVVIPTVVHAGL
jgi:hypothetical protein